MTRGPPNVQLRPLSRTSEIDYPLSTIAQRPYIYRTPASGCGLEKSGLFYYRQRHTGTCEPEHHNLVQLTVISMSGESTKREYLRIADEAVEWMIRLDGNSKVTVNFCRWLLEPAHVKAFLFVALEESEGCKPENGRPHPEAERNELWEEAKRWMARLDVNSKVKLNFCRWLLSRSRNVQSFVVLALSKIVIQGTGIREPRDAEKISRIVELYVDARPELFKARLSPVSELRGMSKARVRMRIRTSPEIRPTRTT